MRGGGSVGDNAINKVITTMKKLLVYQPSGLPDPFVLDENQQDGKKSVHAPASPNLSESLRQF